MDTIQEIEIAPLSSLYAQDLCVGCICVGVAGSTREICDIKFHSIWYRELTHPENAEIDKQLANPFHIYENYLYNYFGPLKRCEDKTFLKWFRKAQKFPSNLDRQRKCVFRHVCMKEIHGHENVGLTLLLLESNGK